MIWDDFEEKTCSMCGKEFEAVTVMSPNIDKTKRHMCKECARKEMGGMMFRVQGGGDASVGMNDVDASVMFIDNITWDEDSIKMMKSFLREFYDVPESCVKTEEEYEKECEYERELEKDLLTNDGDADEC